MFRDWADVVKASLIPIDTHVMSIASRHPAFPSRLRNKAMSPQIYDEVQQFLSTQWGPLGGWCQAVMFASDLKPVKRPTVKRDKSLPTGIDTSEVRILKREPSPAVTSPKDSSDVPRPDPKRSRSSARLDPAGSRSSTRLAVQRSRSSTSVVAHGVNDIKLHDI